MAKIDSRRAWNTVLLAIGSLIFLAQAAIAVILCVTMYDVLSSAKAKATSNELSSLNMMGMTAQILALAAVGLTLVAFTLLGFAAREYGRLEGPTKPRWYEVVFLGPLLFAKALIQGPAVREMPQRIDYERTQ